MTGSAGKDPQEGGAGKGRGAARRPSAAELVQALADKDRQLRDLTEQSLGFLEDLAELRRRESERVRISVRLGELERLLADSRRRLRSAGVRVPEDTAEVPAWQVVFSGPAGVDAARAAAGSLPAGSVVWVGTVDDLPADADADKDVQWVTAREARTPAQCWNLGMATTRAPWVMFLAEGVGLEGGVALPDPDDARRAALLQPRLLRGDGVEIGLHEPGGMLRLQPLPAPEKEAPRSVPFASPEAFVLRRAAFESLGTFDEAVLGSLALADYAIRARSAGYEVSVASGLELRVPPATGIASGKEGGGDDQRDLLLVLAAHRPEDLGRALGDSTVLWELERGQVPAYVSWLFQRATGRDVPQGQGELVSAIVAAMVAQTAPGGAALDPLRQACAALRRVVGGGPDPHSRSLEQVTAEVSATASAAAERLQEVGRQRDRQEQRSQELEKQCRQLEQELRQQEQHCRQLGERAAAAELDRDAARGQVEVLQKEFEAIATAVDLVRQPHPAHVRERLLQMKEETSRLGQVLEAAGAPDPGALLQSLFDVRQRLAETETLVNERNRWIAILLREVSRRRLFPRPLQEHEKAFLEHQDPPQ